MIKVELEVHEGIVIGIALADLRERTKTDQAKGLITKDDAELVLGSICSAYDKVGTLVEAAVAADEADMQLG